MKTIFQKLLRAAAWLSRALNLTRAAGAIHRWLEQPTAPARDDAAPVADVPAAEHATDAAPAVHADEGAHALESLPQPAQQPAPQPAAAESLPTPPRESVAAAAPGKPEIFSRGTHLHGSALREYKLYAPPGATGSRHALVVMLHGCSQDPDDFAAGTGMNECAREQGFFVLYPAQSKLANSHRCWNWFRPDHQQRDSGEPAWITELTRSVIEHHPIDPQRVYIAGLSAGGAMAAVVAEAYPDVFAAVGVHSGLPVGAASNVIEAIAAMRSGASFRLPWNVMADIASAALGASAEAAQPTVPTIVFHGDKDETVHPRNGEQIIAALVAARAATSDARGATDARDARDGASDAVQTASARAPHVEQGEAAARHTRTVHRADDGTALAEHWVVHGAGHAWSGGRPSGSFTDADGPDATREMLRFFFEPAREKAAPEPAAL